jgi:hypothetical protein
LGRILTGHVPLLSIEITRECPHLQWDFPSSARRLGASRAAQ